MSETNVITPECILSYPHLHQPRPDDNNNLFYQASLIFPEGTDLTPLKNIVRNAAIAQFGQQADEKIKSGALKVPFRTDWQKKGYPENSTFFSCKSKSAPGIVGLAPGPDGKPAPYQGEIYPGLFVRASVRAYYYSQQGGGIGIGLNNVQVLRDGERLDGRLPASEEFEADPSSSVAGAADLSDLM